MIRRVAAALFLALLTVPGAGAADSPPEVRRILLVWTPPDHPFSTHMYEHECRVLAKCLNQTPGVEAIVCPDPEWPADESVLDGVSGIVYYSRYAGDIVLSEVHGAKFRELLGKGVGFTAIHWATKAEDRKLVPAYIDVLGGAFHSFEGWGLNTSTRPLVQVDPSHPVCNGWKPYDLHDEFYLGLRWHEKVKPILKVNVDGKDQVVTWVFERADGGRSFGTTLGHFHENFEIEEFRRAIVNGILWSAKVEVPAGGALVELSGADLDLAAEPGEYTPIADFKLPAGTGPVRSVAPGKDGKLVCLAIHEAGRTRAKVFDATGALVGTPIDSPVPEQFMSGFPRVTALPGGDVLYQSDDARRIAVIDGTTGALRRESDSGAFLTGYFAVSADGSRAYEAVENKLWALNLTTLQGAAPVTIGDSSPTRRYVVIAANKQGRVVVVSIDPRAEMGGQAECLLVDPSDGAIVKSAPISLGVVAGNTLAEAFTVATIRDNVWDRVEMWSSADLSQRASHQVRGETQSTFAGLDSTGRFLVVQHWMVEFVTVLDTQTGRWLGGLGPEGRLAVRTGLAADSSFAVMVGGEGDSGSVLQTNVAIYDLTAAPKPVR